ncbi:MAG: integration host factor subunit alpha, partial [Gammaproteobacteria bacterium]|nr:integration host factor subunit alpha [Gammaproteobacteria bacterium]
MALIKANLAAGLYDDIGLNKREARDIVEDFFEEIRAALESGQPVKLFGFGNFDLRDKKESQDRGRCGHL